MLEELQPTAKKETSHKGLVDLSKFVFPPRGPDYQKPALSKHKRVPRVIKEEIETTYEEAIAATYAILTRNERKCTCPRPPPGIKFFGNGASWIKRKEKGKDGMIVLEERTPPIAKVRHYEGCILCTPTPSPRSSEEDTGRELFAPSKQNPGPPPSSPPPFPNVEEPSSHRPGFCRRTTLLPVGFNQLKAMFGGLSDDTEPGPSNRSIEDMSDLASQLTDVGHGPYNSQSYHDEYINTLNNVPQPFGRNENHVISLDLQGGGLAVSELQYVPNLSLGGSTECLTGANAASSSRRRQYPGYDSSGKNPDNDEIIPTKRGSIFDRGNRVPDLESGIRRFPFVSRPVFPGNSGVVRLPDEEIPRPQVMGVDGVYEMIDLGMVDLNEPESATTQGEAGTQSRLERAKGVVVRVAVIISSPKILKSQVQIFWKWCRVQKWAIFLLGVLFCITIASMI